MSERAHVTIKNDPEMSRYEAVDEAGVVVGFSEYRLRDGAVVFTHTVVDDAFEGHGVGSTLARAALDDVRASGARVVALCPFIKAYIDNHPDYQDLLV
jgi:uncharacterized protein